jgi:hypothetical protein
MNDINDILDQKAEDLFQTPNLVANNDEIKEESTNNDINIAQLKATVYQMKDQLDGVIRALEGKQVTDYKKENPDTDMLSTGERIVEGVFNGESMVGADGKEYSIPPNYASKSKLVEGDMLKLTITNSGSFIFKQIGPIERKSLIGEIITEGDQYSVIANGRTYKALTASVTFFKGKAGDEAVILVPKDGESEWAAVDNVISK